MYDIRGIFNKDLTISDAYLIGKGLGTFYLQNNINRVAVGRDNRVSGGVILENFIKGLLQTGCNVVNFNFVLNPLLYFSWYNMSFSGTAIVTASHNPPEYNGFKFSMNKKPLVGGDYQAIYKICKSGEFKKGKGKETKGEIWNAYKNNILNSIKIGRKLKVAIDCGNGTGGLFAPQLLKELGCEVIPVFCESDGSFPNHNPYPQKIELYGDLRKKILTEHADVGLSVDGDGDRLGVFDEKGMFIEADRLAILFVKDICEKNQNKKIVMNVSTSLALIDYVKSVGGQFTFSKTGYPYVTEKMNEVGAIFGGEIAGHFFFKDKYFGFDDALYAGVRLLEILSNTNETLSSIIKKLPKYFETREFRIEIPEGIEKNKTIQKIKESIKKEYPSAEILDFDGIRFSFPDSWGLIRASNTEPLFTGRAEAKTKEELEKIKNILHDELKKNKIDLKWEIEG